MLKRKGFLPLLIGLLAFLLSITLDQIQSKERDNPEEEYSQFLDAQKSSLNQELNQLQASYQQNDLYSSSNTYKSLYTEEKISLFIEENEKTLFWSEEESPINEEDLRAEEDFILSLNYIYLKQKKVDGELTFYALKQIARRYPYQNSYLKKQITKEWKPFLKQISNAENWDFDLNADENPLNLLLKSLLLLLSIGLFIYSIPILLLGHERKPFLVWILLLLVANILIYLMDPFNWSQYWIFNPTVFSFSFWASSAGSLFLNSISIFLISYFLLRLIKKKESIVLKSISFFFFLLLSSLALRIVYSAVLNSQFSFELDNLFKLDLGSYLLILSFGLILLSSLIWLQKALFKDDIIKHILVYVFLFTLHQLFLTEESYVLLHTVLSVFLLLLLEGHYLKSRIPDLIFILFLLFAFSASTAFLIDQVMDTKENSSRRVLLQKLAEERDPLLEYLFTEVQNEIGADDSLKSFFDQRWDQKSNYEQYLRKEYLNGYWDRYRINFTLCSNQDSILIGGRSLSQSCFQYFQNRIYSEGDQISSINLFQLSNLAGRIDYIGEIPLGKESEFKLYLELSRDYFSEDLGYPELFLNSEDKQLRKKLEEYSYAVYYKNELINSEGDYVYTQHSDSSKAEDFAFYSHDTPSYSHTKLQKNENISIILSKRKVDLFAHISRVTYLLVIYGLLFLLFSLLFEKFPFHHSLIISDFSTKIRLLISSTLLIALVLFLSGTTYYIQEQYEAKNSKAIEEKLRSISLELDSKIGDRDSLDAAFSPYVTSILIKFSNVFYTDINLYDSEGKLYASSRPELFDQNIKSRRMNFTAYSSVAKNDRSKLVQKESIGELGYLSAYVPLKNRQNELLAYLNLPYFARQEELKEEISAFLAPTINSYVIIFTLALLISFLLINQISKPLLLIRNYISKLKLGSNTELIDWQSNDEIGELVKEYNRIAIELGQSAEELAKREREGAWREMAKQIAHEIKNPLTPMKLSIQHLQRSSGEEGVDLRARINKTADTLISQIESLTAIAEAFSSFAKFPDKELGALDLSALIKEVAHLYENQANIEIKEALNEDLAIVLADRDLILRIFNNLIKNAIQANDKEGISLLEISISKDESRPGFLKVEVKDNGKGISDEQAQYIFEPSFTTKSSGTGLGLAIVKRSIEQLGGEISMKSILNEGTTFFLYFPKA